MKIWLNKWFSFSWKKLALVAALMPVMYYSNKATFPKVDAFLRDSLQFLNNNTNAEKSIVTINMNLIEGTYPRPFTFKTIKDVVEKIASQKPRLIIFCFSPLEVNGNDQSEDIREELFNFLKQYPNIYIYSNGFADRNDFLTDKYFEKFPRTFLLTMLIDLSLGKKHRRAITFYEKTGVAVEFSEIQKLGYKTKGPNDFQYGWYFWSTNQPYIKTLPQNTFGSYDAYTAIQNNFEGINLKDKTVILGSSDEYSMLGSESVFNLLWPIGTPGYKDFPPADSLANYMNFYINGDYVKLIPNVSDIALLTFFLMLLVFLRINTKRKLIIFVSTAPILVLAVFITYLADSFYIDFSRSITTLFFLQYLGIPIIMFSMFKEQESKKLEEINDARIDALLTVSEKVAHDIRSPLSVINLVMTDAKFSNTEYKEIFDAAVARIDETATKILTRYRTNTGKENELTDSVDLAAILQNIIKEKKVLRPNVNFSISIEAQAVKAKAIRLDIERIFSNILDNSLFALKAHTNASIEIKLTSSNGKLITTFSDNGIGIPEQVLKLLGKERVTTKMDNNEGNGIGLLHAKRIIEKFEGNFEIQSQLNIGTTIKIILPKAE